MGLHTLGHDENRPTHELLLFDVSRVREYGLGSRG